MEGNRGGRLTYERLLNWDRGQADSERLALQLLHLEGYEALDPIHPLGGKDGTKDIICYKDGEKWIGASYFPRRQHDLSQILKKFGDDLKGVKKNNAQGFIFVTNQELHDKERLEFHTKAKNENIYNIDLFHLERISSILNKPEGYGVRLQFLDIEMSKEDQLSYIARKEKQFNELQDMLQRICADLEQTNEGIKILTKYPELSEKEKTSKRKAMFVHPQVINNPLNPELVQHLHQCSRCGYEYIITESKLERPIVPNSFGLTTERTQFLAECPECGKKDEIESRVHKDIIGNLFKKFFRS